MSPSFDAHLAGRLSRALETGVGAPGAQAAVILANGLLWTAGAGRSTEEVPMTPDLLTAIGSITKVYTAALALDLVQDGALSLDDRLERWLPNAPNSAGVTLRQLLLHTSGLASDDPALPRVCDPGRCQSYGNSGYDLLGEVIETATGEDYAAVLRGRILQPSRLTATFFLARRRSAVGPSRPASVAIDTRSDQPRNTSSRPKRLNWDSAPPCRPCSRSGKNVSLVGARGQAPS